MLALAHDGDIEPPRGGLTKSHIDPVNPARAPAAHATTLPCLARHGTSLGRLFLSRPAVAHPGVAAYFSPENRDHAD
jgi:hypothetical protein